MTADPPKKRRAIDTLVARDQTAVFWFVVACITAGLCAWYLVIMSDELKARPPFVVMDGNGAYYVAPGLNYNAMAPMHLSLTELAVEALFEREPNGIVHSKRLPYLCTKTGWGILKKKIESEARYFSQQNATQTVTIESRKILGTGSTIALTEAKGTVHRRSFFNNRPQEETYTFYIQFFWRLNPDIRRNKAFPSVIDGVPKYQLEKISDS